MSLVGLALLALAAAAPPPADPRPQLGPVAAALDQAVGRVSPPSPFFPPGLGDGCRSYAVPGYGAVFVLAPRLLPGRVSTPSPAALTHLEHARRALESGLDQGTSAETRENIERTLAELRESLRAEEKARDGPSAAAATARERELAELQQQMALFERQAEEARERAQHMLIQALLESGALQAPEPAPASAQGPVVGPPAGAVPKAAATAPTLAPVAAAAGGANRAAPPPPWQSWLAEDQTLAGHSPDQVIADVRGALAAALSAQAARLAALAGEGAVVVTVDFVPASDFPPESASHTLVMRARGADLQLRAQGRIGDGELRERLSFAEY